MTKEELVAAVEAEEREWLSAEEKAWLSTDDIHPYKSRVPYKSRDTYKSRVPQTKGNTVSRRNTVSFPKITKFSTYLLRHYAASIVEEIGQRMYDGDLAMYFDVSDFTEDCMAMRDCRIFPSMSFWWEDRFSFLADLEVYIESDVHTDAIRGRRNCTVYATVLFDFADQIMT